MPTHSARPRCASTFQPGLAFPIFLAESRRSPPVSVCPTSPWSPSISAMLSPTSRFAKPTRSRSFLQSQAADMRTAIVDRPIDVSALLSEVADVRHGAAVLFVGTVRDTNDGSPVSGLDYSSYAGMAEQELAAIVMEAVE